MDFDSVIDYVMEALKPFLLNFLRERCVALRHNLPIPHDMNNLWDNVF